jgi:hypothetical protein
MKQIGSIEKKIENLTRNLTILLSDKLQKFWLCRHTFMANSPLVAIGDRIAHPGITCSIVAGGVTQRISNHCTKVARFSRFIHWDEILCQQSGEGCRMDP